MINLIDKIAIVLALVGAINWGFIGLLNLDLVKLIFGFLPILQRIVYILVGVAGVYVAFLIGKNKCKK